MFPDPNLKAPGDKYSQSLSCDYGKDFPFKVHRCQEQRQVAAPFPMLVPRRLMARSSRHPNAKLKSAYQRIWDGTSSVNARAPHRTVALTGSFVPFRTKAERELSMICLRLKTLQE
jgi:hypothetical protein